MSTATRAMDRAQAQRIADQFRPSRAWGNRWDYYYTRTKLGSDPLYPGICDALRGSSAPLLDLGCGLGLLAHALRADGQAMEYRGVDVDAGKIARARRAAERSTLPGVQFDAVDLANRLPTHRGSIALLDVLQFLTPAAQRDTLDAACSMLVPGAKLVIRTGLADGSQRARVTRGVDALSRVFGWMQGERERYPDEGALRATFAREGLQAEFMPLYGRTPFNNWRVVAWRD